METGPPSFVGGGALATFSAGIFQTVVQNVQFIRNELVEVGLGGVSNFSVNALCSGRSHAGTK